MVSLIAFEPFQGRRRNKAADVGRVVAGMRGIPIVYVPVTRAGVAEGVSFARAQPGAVLWLGEYDGSDIVLELRARNNLEGSPLTPDMPLNAAVDSSRRLVPERLAAYSLDAGDYYCNAALFELVRGGLSHRAAFLHIPIAMKTSDAAAQLVAIVDHLTALPMLNDRLLQTRKEKLGALRQQRAVIVYFSPLCNPCRMAKPVMDALRGAMHQAQLRGEVSRDVKFRLYNVDLGGAKDIPSWPDMRFTSNHAQSIPFRSLREAEFLQRVKQAFPAK